MQGMFKLSIEDNNTYVSSICFLSCVSFWHVRLCLINSRFVDIMSSLGLIPKLKKILKNVKLVVKQKSQKGVIKVLNKVLNWLS